MVKPLSFKGDGKQKKRKRAIEEGIDDGEPRTKPVISASEIQLDGTTQADTEADDSWVNADLPKDVSGPVVIVLPTDPPTCLSCDAMGKVFASDITNIVDKDAMTVEPHDVRQVWVANRVAGTESFSFKGHHGKYVFRLGVSL